jgi:hypothetical protein
MRWWSKCWSGLCATGRRSEAAGVLVGTALNDGDAEFVEHWCVQVGTRAGSGSPLLGLAGLRLGHTARRFGRISDEALALAKSLAIRTESDPRTWTVGPSTAMTTSSFMHLW